MVYIENTKALKITNENLIFCFIIHYITGKWHRKINYFVENFKLIIMVSNLTNLKKVSTVQIKTIRKATYWPPGCHTSAMLKVTGLDSIHDRAISLIINYLNKTQQESKSLLNR